MKKNYEDNVLGISFEKKYDEIYLNSSSTDLALTLNINSAGVDNNNIVWTSSDEEIATISSAGVVTAKKIGSAKITATTEDGKFNASMNISVKKKIVIVIGASQVTRMEQYKKNYNSENYNYTIDDETLIYVDKSGSGIEYQYGDGFAKALEHINSYETEKDMVEFYIYFPLSGNTIKMFICDNVSNDSGLGIISVDNENINEYAKYYNEAIKNVKDMGYNVFAYVVSMHPVKVSQSSYSDVVTAGDSKACNYNYRSNRKYYLFNNAIEEIITTKYNDSLNYISLFPSIMETNDDEKNFSFKITYNTTDGIHWNEATTITYVDMMLNYSGKL